MKLFALILLLCLVVTVTASPLPVTTARMTYRLTHAEYMELKRRMRAEGSSFNFRDYIKWLNASRAGKPKKPSPSPRPSPSPKAPPTGESLPPPPPAPQQSSPSGMVAEILAVHNKERALVNVPPLTWSAELAASSQRWANTMVKDKLWKHSKFPGVGENLWKGWGTGTQVSYSRMVQGWADEKKDFVYGTFPDVNPNGGVVGHYTQMVWRDTSQVGCATAGQYSDRSFGLVLVCQYKKPGNWIGQKVY